MGNAMNFPTWAGILQVLFRHSQVLPRRLQCQACKLGLRSCPGGKEKRPEPGMGKGFSIKLKFRVSIDQQPLHGWLILSMWTLRLHVNHWLTLRKGTKFWKELICNKSLNNFASGEMEIKQNKKNTLKKNKTTKTSWRDVAPEMTAWVLLQGLEVLSSPSSSTARVTAFLSGANSFQVELMCALTTLPSWFLKGRI